METDPEQEEDARRRAGGKGRRWDERLALAARSGDRDARNKLYLDNLPLILKLTASAKGALRTLARNSGLDTPLSDADIEQQAFVVFCDLLEGWNPDEETFNRRVCRKLPGTLRHYVRDHASRWINRTAPLLALDDSTGEQGANGVRAAVDPGPSPDRETADRLQWEIMTASLPSALRSTVALRYSGDLSSAQIARLKGVTRRTVDRNLNTAHALVFKVFVEEISGCRER